MTGPTSPPTTDHVYHASPVAGLRVIEPRVSTHGRHWICACRSPVMAAVFLARWGGDLTCQVGAWNGVPFIVERFRSAFARRHDGRPGSLYTLPAGAFAPGPRPEEVVSQSGRQT